MSCDPELQTNNMRWSDQDAFVIFILALCLRLVSVTITTITSLNTYSQSDANGFAAHADWVASTITSGSIPALHFNNIYHVWGAIISPFWFFPGPSRVYARVGIAILGAVAVYNVYVTVRFYYSKYASVLAVTPMIIYPSFLFLHAAILREAMVLFGLTTATRLLLAPNPRQSTLQVYGMASIFIGMSTLMRVDNLPIYILVLVVAAFLKLKPWHQYEYLTKSTIIGSIAISPILVHSYGRQTLDQLIYLRQVRARGRTKYLGSVLPETIPKAIAFSWIGAIYFLFTPFPWMVSHIIDLVIMFEGIVNFIYVMAAITGARVLSKKTLAGATALVVGIVVGTALYGLGTVNVGTAVRHRQMLLWAIFLLGGIGLAEHLQIQPIDRYI